MPQSIPTIWLYNTHSFFNVNMKTISHEQLLFAISRIHKERNRTNLVLTDIRAVRPKMKNIISIPECSKLFIWEGFNMPSTKYLRWGAYTSSMHKSIKAPITTIYNSKYLSLPPKPGTGFHTRIRKVFGLVTYLYTLHHICHKPTNKNSVPGTICPLNDPIPSQASLFPFGKYHPLNSFNGPLTHFGFQGITFSIARYPKKRTEFYVNYSIFSESHSIPFLRLKSKHKMKSIHLFTKNTTSRTFTPSSFNKISSFYKSKVDDATNRSEMVGLKTDNKIFRFQITWLKVETIKKYR